MILQRYKDHDIKTPSEELTMGFGCFIFFNARCACCFVAEYKLTIAVHPDCKYI
jgi:hypothetical protein